MGQLRLDKAIACLKLGPFPAHHRYGAKAPGGGGTAIGLNGGGLRASRGGWYVAAGLRLHTPPTPLIDALHCCNVEKLQFGEVPSLNWAQYGACFNTAKG